MFGEEGGADHAHPVMHPAGLPEFAHAGIDDGNAGTARLPGVEGGFVFRPGEVGEFGADGLRAQFGVLPEQVDGEFPPEEFFQEGFHARGRSQRGGLLPDRAGRDFTEMHVRGEARGAGDAGMVARLGIVLDRPGQEFFQALLGAGFAGCPGLAQAAGPVGFVREQTPIGERVGWDAGDAGDFFRRWMFFRGMPASRQALENGVKTP